MSKATIAVPHKPVSLIQQERLWHGAQTAILEQLALGVGSDEVFDAILDSVARTLPDMLCSVLVRDVATNTLNPLIQSEGIPQFYIGAIKGLAIEEGEGSCGSAASSGRRVIVEDISSHPYWKNYRELAARAGLAACWSQPIFSPEGSVQGTFGLYYEQPRSPTEFELLVIEGAANLAGIALSRDRYLQEITKREAQYRALVEHAPVSISEYSKDGTLLWMNPMGVRVSGRGSGTPHNSRQYLDRVQDSDKGYLEHNFKQCCAGKSRRFTVSNSAGRIFSGSFVPLLDTSGEVDRVMCIFEDITKRKKLETALEHERDTLELKVRERTVELELAIEDLHRFQKDLNEIIDAFPDPLILIDREGFMHRVSMGVEESLGYSRNELQGRHVTTLVPDHLKAENNLQRVEFSDALAAGVDVELKHEVIIRHQDGRELPMEVKIRPISLSGEQFFALAARDMTTQLAKNDALRTLRAEAERATASKSRFLAAASHDLRQPLQSVGLYLSVLEKKMSDPDETEIGTKIRTSLNVMAELLDVLLDLSNLESGAITLNLRDAPIGSLLQKIETSSQPQAAEKGLQLTFGYSDIVVHTDVGLLQRILANLVANAINYTDTGEVRVELAQRGDRLQISVTDTGCGIPEDKLDTIFEEYVQVGNTVRDRRQGLGLGLAIVKHISRMLGCPVHVCSTLGEGSTFSLTVPLATSQRMSLSPGRVALAESEQQDTQVLLLEDDPEVLAATAMLLESRGVIVYPAHSGTDAMKIVDSGVCPDLILSDYRLPGENGMQVLKRVRAHLGCDTPAIFLTGDSAVAKIKAAELAHTHVFQKPVAPDRLLHLISSILA